MTLVFRSGCREEFWGKYVLINSCPLNYTSETFVKSVKKYLRSLTAWTKMWTFLVIFQWFWLVVKTTIFFITHLSNCVFIMFINFYFIEILIFFLVSSFYFSFIEKIGLFEKSLFLYTVYQCEHVLSKLGESPLFW